MNMQQFAPASRSLLDFKRCELGITDELKERGATRAIALLAERICIVVVETGDELIGYGLSICWPAQTKTPDAMMRKARARAAKHLAFVQRIDGFHWERIKNAERAEPIHLEDAGSGP